MYKDKHIVKKRKVVQFTATSQYVKTLVFLNSSSKLFNPQRSHLVHFYNLNRHYTNYIHKLQSRAMRTCDRYTLDIFLFSFKDSNH